MWAKTALIWAFNNDFKNTEKAVEQATKRTKQVPLNPLLPYEESARAYLVQKQYHRIPAVLEFSPDAKSIPRGMALLAIAYHKLGDADKSHHQLESLMERSTETAGGSPSFYTAMVYASRGETEQAFQWLEKSIEDNEIEVYWLKVEPEFESLYGDPRWQEMLDKVGFPE